MLNERDIKIASEVAAGEKTIVQICEDNNISRVAYYKKLKQNPEFAATLKELQDANKEEALNILRANSHKAASLIVSAIAGETRISKPRLDAARDLLDRIGLNPAIKYQVTDEEEPKNLTLNDIQTRLQELKQKRDIG